MSIKSKSVKIGIMSYEDFKQRTLMIAKGKYKPKKSDPKIWFPSVKSLANVLSEENQQLLKIISDSKPDSIAELESVTGRKASNLLRTLRKMETYGLVRLTPNLNTAQPGRAPLVPSVIYNMADVHLSWN